MATDVKMPEPAAWISTIQCVGPRYGSQNYGKLPVQSLQPGYYKHEPLYTASQLEQYAEERVREALEAAAKACEAERALFMEQAVANNGRESDFAFGSVNSSERLAEVIRALKKESGDA